MLYNQLFTFFLPLLLLISQVYSTGTTCDITHYGASEGTRDQGPDVGAAIMRAYNECVLKNSGATLLIPAGKEFRMTSHVNIKHNPVPFTIQWEGTIHLALLFTIKGADTNSAMFYFQNCAHIKIQGSGTFEGYGPLYRPHGVSHTLTFYGRPQFFLFQGCSYVTFTGLHLNNSPSFHITFNGDHGYFSDITIHDTGVLAGTTDGISLSCNTCTVSNCDIRNGDDCVVVKSPSTNIQVDHATCRDGNGVGLGTVGPHGVWDVSDITFSNIKMFNTVGLYIKSYPSSTGGISNILFENVEGVDVKYMIWVTQFFLGITSPQGAMTWENIRFNNIKGSTTRYKKARFLVRCNQQSLCKDITLDNIAVTQLGGRKVPNIIENAHVLGLAGL